MKDLKIPLGWLIPIIGFILLLGWFLGRSGWNLTELDTGIAKLAPPASVILQSTATVQPLVTSATTDYISNKSMFAVLVGVTDETAFSTQDAMDYTYMASVSTVTEAIVALEKVFESNDIVFVVHVPDLRVTPGNPGACKLYLHQVNRLTEYSPGWIIGGNNIVPDEFESGLQFCYSQ